MFLSRKFRSFGRPRRSGRPVLVENLETRQLLSLTIDVRLAGGGNTVEATHVGQTIQMEVFATVPGSNGVVTDDGIWTIIGSFLSTNQNNGSVRGSLFFNGRRPFTASASQDSDSLPYAAASTDLDGDGDPDLGSNNDASATGMVVARAGAPQWNTTAGQRWKLGDLTFTVTDLVNNNGSTRIAFRPRRDPSDPAKVSPLVGLWIEDNVTYDLESIPQLNPTIVTTGVTITTQNGDGTATPPADTSAPTATLGTAPSNVTTAGATPLTFTVNYVDNVALDLGSIGAGDVLVSGPGLNNVAAALVSTSGTGGVVTATYRIDAPGGSWKSTDNGTYTLKLAASQVKDTSNNFVAANNSLGSFTVNVPAPPAPTLRSDGTLVIMGTDSDDVLSLGWDADRRRIQVRLNGDYVSFPFTSVKQMEVRMGAGNDSVMTDPGITRRGFFDGGLGKDTIVGTSGNDRINGGSNSDVLRGGAGNDIIDGGNQNDTMYGDAGDDRLLNSAGADVFNGGAGIDTADYTKSTVPLTISIDDVANDGAAGEGDNVRTDVENVWGGSGNDLIIGSAVNNYLLGGPGNDTIFGGDGSDRLEGGRHADQLFGEVGHDTLLGEDGERDTLNGGVGTDRYTADAIDVRVSAEVKI